MTVLAQGLCRYDVVASQIGVAMRPNKQINSGAHRSGTGKNRYFGVGLPEVEDEVVEDQPSRLLLPDSVRIEPTHSSTKYEGRGTVGPLEGEPDVTVDLTHEEWVDPLDTEEQVDLSRIEIDLRNTLRKDAPDTYYQRFGSRVPGHN